jgi:hypothetical protein
MYWTSPDVSNHRLVGEKFMLPTCGQQDKESAKPKILNVRDASSLPSIPYPLGTRNAITLDELCIDALWILLRRNETGNVKPISTCKVTNRQLLDEAGHACSFASIIDGRFRSSAHKTKQVGGELFQAQVPKSLKSFCRCAFHSIARNAICKTPAKDLSFLKTFCSRPAGFASGTRPERFAQPLYS